MGNSQSSSEKDAGAGQVENQVDARLRRFHTGASDATTTTSPSPTPPLRRTSTTATGTASEKRHASLGRSGAGAMSRGTSGSSSSARKSGTVSATGSPRASDREKAWIRSATRRSSTMFSGGDSTRSLSRGRTRSGSIGVLLSGGGSRGPTLHEDEVFDPHRDVTRSTTPSKRAEVTFRRNKSIELSDVVDPTLSMRETSPGPLTPLGTISSQLGDDPTDLASPTLNPADDLVAAKLPSHLQLLSNDNSPISGSPAGDQTLMADVYNPLFPPVVPGTSTRDPLGRSQPAAFPSYLKIPTLIPSQYASPTTSTPSSPSTSDIREWSSGEPISVTPQPSTFPTKLGGGGTAAAAILNTEDVVIKPGGASKASTPTEEETLICQGALQIHGSDKGSLEEGSSESADGGVNGIPSRTPTPTPGNLRGARAMTPTGETPPAMSAIAPNQTPPIPSSGEVAAATLSSLKRAGLNAYTGSESGTNTPGLPNLPIGLTSAPSSALTPKAISTYNLDGKDSNAAESPSTPLSKAINNLSMTNQNFHDKENAQANNRSGGAASQSGGTNSAASSQVPLMPITVKWRGSGKEVFVTGTFANEWRSKILLKKTAGSGKRAEYSCVLHLAPGTHRLKFIVDDRWRVSRDLSTASDGEGNLTNYIEVAHMGPAHPGPLSAPGEDLLVGEDEEEKKKKGTGPLGIAAHKATLDLMEEARRAEALRRGDLLDVFGNEKVRTEEKWTQQIPESIIKAQIAEELYRNEMAEKKPESSKHSRKESNPPSNVPVPPTLPRQLEKVILNSSPAAVAGAVDDTSVLPAPNHAVLHHLTASAIKSGVIATGCTMRYRKKYITTIYYRAAN